MAKNTKKVASKSKPKAITAKKKAAAKSKPANSKAKASNKKSAPAKKKAIKTAKTPKPVKAAKKATKPVAAAKRKAPAKTSLKKATKRKKSTKAVVVADLATPKRRAAKKASVSTPTRAAAPKPSASTTKPLGVNPPGAGGGSVAISRGGSGPTPVAPTVAAGPLIWRNGNIQTIDTTFRTGRIRTEVAFIVADFNVDDFDGNFDALRPDDPVQYRVKEPLIPSGATGPVNGRPIVRNALGVRPPQ